MATVNSVQVAGGYPLYMPDSGQVAVAKGVYEISAALSKDDKIAFCTIPAGCEIIDGWLRGDDIDTGTEEFELDIGTADDPDALLNSGVITGDVVTETNPEGGIKVALHGLLKDGPITCAAETTIYGTVTAAAKAGGTGTLSLTLYYTRSTTVGS